MTFSRLQLLPLILVLAIIAAGGYIRLSHLTVYNLTQEELSLMYVGESLAHDKPPELPSGRWYTRGVEYSRMTWFARQHIATPEVAIRLPSALLGTLCLVVMAIGTWLIAGPWAAVGSTLLLAVYPDVVIQSRLGRFYMLQLMAGLLALFMGWFVLARRSTAPRIATWAGIIAVTLLLMYAARIQVTALATLLTWWLCLAAVGLWDVRRGGMPLSRSVPLQFAVGTVLLASLMILVKPSLVDQVLIRAVSLPYWARVNRSPTLYYFIRLMADFSVVVVSMPFAFAYLWWKRRSLGLYLLAMFGFPALLFTLTLPFKAERFVMLALPPLFIAVSAALADAGSALVRASTNWFPRSTLSPRARSTVTSVSVALLFVWLVVVMHAPRTALYAHFTRTEPNWRAAGEILKSRPELAGIPFGATKSLPPRFYWGRIDFNVGRNFLEQWSFVPLGEAGVPTGRVGAYVTQPVGSPDLYAGVPVLTTVQSIRRRFPDARAVIIGIDGQARYFQLVDPTLLQALSSQEELCKLRCGSLELYHWQFQP